MLKLSENKIELGNLDENIIYPFHVTITNTSNEDITPSITVSCGCTTPVLEPYTIPANGTADLSCTFDTTGKKGLNHKRIYITCTSNSGNTTQEVIDFYAKVGE